METTITKTKTETYTLRGKGSLWAKINLDCGKESVNVMISSDYGEFNYYWGACGTDPKKFLANLNWHYCMKKLMGGTDNLYIPDFNSRLKSFKKLIIESRKEQSITKEYAREAWKEMLSIFDYCGNSNDVYFSKVMDSSEFANIIYDFEAIPEDTRVKPVVNHFWENVWLPFVGELKKELEV